MCECVCVWTRFVWTIELAWTSTQEYMTQWLQYFDKNLAHTFWSTALVNPQNISGSPLQIFKKVQTATA